MTIFCVGVKVEKRLAYDNKQEKEQLENKPMTIELEAEPPICWNEFPNLTGAPRPLWQPQLW